MKIGLFGIDFYANYGNYYRQIIERLEKEDVSIAIYEPLYKSLKEIISFKNKVDLFSDYKDIRKKINVLFSIGGDGTILSSVTLVRDSGIPILGINLGNLGFLSSTSKDEIDSTITDILNKNYILDKRDLIRLETNEKLFGDLNFAINEFTVQKKDNLSMVKIHVYINDIFLNTYFS